MLFTALALVLAINHVAALRRPDNDASASSPPGCSVRYLFDGVTKHVYHLHSGSKSRSYSFHLPSTYNQNRGYQYPVVMGFHGSSSIGLFFEADTKLDRDEFSADKIMVYPNGLGGSWAGPSYHTDSTVDEDIQFVQDIIKDLEKRACIDTSRVYATGVSNGGGFVGTLACSEAGSKLFRAFAMGSGAFYTDVDGPDNGCSPGLNPTPILEIHGGSDDEVFYDGGQGEGGLLPSIPAWLESWAQRNGCTGKTEETTHDGDVHRTSWTCGGISDLMEHYKVDSLGHCWADTEPNFSQLTVPQLPAPIQASSIIMEFFDRF